MADENRDQGGGVQPVLPAEGDRARFLPVTRRDRVICALLVSVALVAGYYAWGEVPMLIEAMGSSVSTSGGDRSGSAALEVDAVPSDAPSDATIDKKFGEVSSGSVDGVRYFYDEETDKTYVELSDILRKAEKYDEGWSSEEIPGTNSKSSDKQLASWNGQFVCKEPGYSRQSRNSRICCTQSCLFNGSKNRYCESRGYGEVYGTDLQSYDEYTLELQANCDDYSLLRSYSVLNLSSNQIPTLKKASVWDIGAEPARKIFAKFVCTNIGRKIIASCFAPLLGFAIQSGGMTAADAALYDTVEIEAVAIAERVAPEVAVGMSEAMALEAGELDAQITAAIVARGMANASEGVSMSAEEFTAAVAEDVIAYKAGETCPMFSESFTGMLQELMVGELSVETLPIMANFGSCLIDFYNTEHEGAEVNLVPFSDAQGNLNTVASNVEGLAINTGDYQVSPPSGYKLVAAGFYSSGRISSLLYVDGNTELVRIQKYRSNSHIEMLIKNHHYYMVWFNSDGSVYSDFSGSYSGEQAQDLYAYTYVRYASGVDVYDPSNGIIFYQGDVINVNGSPIDQTQSASGDGYSNFYESGGAVVGNDATYGANGDVEDPGTVNAGKVIDGDGNYGSWNEVLEDGDVSAVDPVGEVVNKSDEVIAPKPEGGEPETLEDVNNGSSVPPERVAVALSVNFDALGSKVSSKFPFCLPTDLMNLANVFSGTRQAPSFTWPVQTPLQQEAFEIEVDLSDFEPVAVVLRAMMNVMLIFAVIMLASRFWELLANIGSD